MFNDIPRSRSYWWSEDCAGVFRDGTAEANGSTLDAAGDLLICEHGGRRLIRIDAHGRIQSIASEYDGYRLNSPNDVTVDQDGCIFFTDPPYGVAPRDREIEFQGVYRLNPELGELILVDDTFDRPNGLAWSVDGQHLYVADTNRCEVRSLELTATGRSMRNRRLIQVDRPDGLRVDTAGNLYVAALDGVRVFSAEGDCLQHVSLPERPANLTFGGPDGQTLFICAGSSLYRVRTALPGHRPATGGS
jgi:gluconolactonase